MKNLSIKLSDEEFNDLKQVQASIPPDWQAKNDFNKYLKLILQMGARQLLLKTVELKQDLILPQESND